MSQTKASVLVISIMSLAVWPARADDCGQYADHVGYRDCLERAAEQSEARLVQTEARLRAHIMRWEEGAAFRQDALRGFDQDRAAYRRYRQSRCDFEASLAAGGNGAGDMRLSCRIELDEQRRAILLANGDALHSRLR